MDSQSLVALLKDLWRLALRKRRGQLGLILVLTVLGAAAEVLTLGALMPFLALIADPAAVENTPIIRDALGLLGLGTLRDHLVALTLLFSAAAILAGTLRVVLTMVAARYVYNLAHDLSTAIFANVLARPYTYHALVNSSTILAGLQHVQGVATGVVLPLLQVASAAIIGVFIATALIAIDPAVAVITFGGFGGIYLAVSLFVRRRLRGNATAIVQSQKEAIRTVQEGLGGIRDVIIDGTQPVFEARFSELERRFWKAHESSYVAAATPRFAVEAAGMALIAGIAAILTSGSGGAASVLPILGVFALGAQRLLPLLQALYSNWALAVSNLGGARAVLDLIGVADEKVAEEPDGPPLPFERAITFRNVSFRYGDDRPPVLDGLDLTITRGMKLMLVGRTGAGKSTVVDLLMGLLAPTSGAIEIDGRRLDATNWRAWRRQIAHVPQSIFLADASIAANIAFGVPPERIDHQRVRMAAERARLAGFVATLPRGLDTVVGERGTALSGGQRQRIGIARALYKGAGVLVLDEATNALDADTEREVLQSIRGAGEITLVMIAHRLAAQDLCDAVIAIEDGKASPPKFRTEGSGMGTVVDPNAPDRK